MKIARLTIILAWLSIAGCAQLPVDPSNMTEGQIREWVKDRSAGVQCVIVYSPWGKGVVISVNLDKGTVANGGVTVDADCKVSVNTEQRLK